MKRAYFKIERRFHEIREFAKGLGLLSYMNSYVPNGLEVGVCIA